MEWSGNIVHVHPTEKGGSYINSKYDQADWYLHVTIDKSLIDWYLHDTIGESLIDWYLHVSDSYRFLNRL